MRLVSYRTALPRYIRMRVLLFASNGQYPRRLTGTQCQHHKFLHISQPYIYIISKFFDKIKCKDFCPLFFATLNPGLGNRSLLRFRLRKFLNPRDNQTSVGLHNHALVETIGIEPILGGRSLPLSSQRPIPMWSK